MHLFRKFLLIFLLFSFASAFATPQVKATKAWTFLIYLNAKNSLDSFGFSNLKDMEKIGSNDQVNIVVEWGSYSKRNTVRMLILKSTDPSKVTSPVIEDLGEVDMGSYKTLEDFIQWGVQHFPAQHYFINVWNHGSGWHLQSAKQRNSLHPLDISWDDLTGNSIKTEELGMAMNYAAGVMKHKVDIYGSDACLMGMAEVADEMSAGVTYFVGSQELEPGPGWPYANFLARWQAIPSSTAPQVARVLVDEYVKSYEGGSNGRAEVTFSAYDVRKLPQLDQALAKLGLAIQQLSAANRAKVLDVINASQNFDYRDYVDLLDFTKNLAIAKLIDPLIISNVIATARNTIIANEVTSGYQNATGMSVWLPTSSYTYKRNADRYQGLQFNQHTQWNSMLAALVQGSDGAKA